MTTNDIVQLLIAERDRLNQAIAALQGGVRRRGRPPASAAAVVAPAVPGVRHRRKRTKAQRDAQAERMRQYWAARKKAEAKEAKK
jgi:hypothetical protein